MPTLYLEIPGVTGNTGATGFEEMIPLSYFSFAADRPVSMETGIVANRVSASPNVHTVSCGKEMDKSSPLLLRETLGTADGKEVKIHFVRTKDDKLEKFVTYTLGGCVVSKYNISADGGDNPATEEIELSFNKLDVEHTEYDADDKIANPGRAGYDLGAAEVTV